jgi:phenylpropionate dioxygenase-like ring-hydroxylating dioxygenase large terminal subunit
VAQLTCSSPLPILIFAGAMEITMINARGDQFVRNAWYVAAWSAEVGRSPFARTMLNQPLVFFRKQDGTPVALMDRCPHKLAPLSRGEVVGDLLQCGYHGMQYDGSGRCVRVPGQPPIPPAARVQSFPLVEKYNAVWIWMGEPERADPALIIDIPECGDPKWGVVDGQYLHFATNYLNLTDNLVDPAHTTYVHQRTIGNSGGEDVPVQVKHGDGYVTAYRWVTGAEPVPIMKTYGKFKGAIDRWQYYHLKLPSISFVDFGATDAGSTTDEAAKQSAFRSFTYNLLTPETDKSTHYFWLHLRNYAVGDTAVDADIARLYTLTFEEDRDILAAIQQQQDLTGVREYVRLAIDQAPQRARLMIQRMVDAEQAPARSVAS